MENKINEVVDEIRTSTKQLHELWKEVGFDEEACSERQSRVLELFKNLQKNIWDGEISLKKKILTSIDENGKEFYHLNKELNTAIPDPEENLSLLELERYLRHSVEELHREVKSRRDRLRELHERERELCERLVEEPSNISKKLFPSKEDLEDLERRIRTLEQEMINREKTFRRLKSDLVKLLDDLELKPSTPFESTILSEVEDLFTLSHQNLQRMRQLNKNYEEKVGDNEKKSQQLHERIRLLNDRLGIDPSEHAHFLNTVDGHKPTTLEKLQQELKRLEELKRQNMARFINQLRRELEMCWEKCYTSEEERNEFTAYFTEDYTDTVLDAHDQEVQRLQDYYMENKHIFSKIKHRNELWNKLVELEEKASDPNRLFGNRGCSLLQEEKERKRVKIELPRIEKELEDIVLNWESKHGQPFLLGKKTISEYIMDQWHIYHEQKEQEKKDRQNARVRQLNAESRLGSRPPSVKRRLARNDTARTSKLRRIGEEQTLGHTTSSTPTRMKSVLQEHDQNALKNVTLQLFPKKEGANLSTAEVSSYSTFSDGIQRRSERENIRSSTVHGVKKTPLLVCRQSPRYPPRGLPKTPKTLPRAATRRSPRLPATRSSRRSPRNSTVSRLVTPPASTTALRSPHVRSHRLGTPNRWSKLSFLM
ncbi:protein regulator of cytokinesis 1-like isoform X2 [Homarus americanus]|nr:protein regulator of cytokinesis 1-like isoform X2 [Homarus americanus]XP_042232734.1 protein regulator of cytokinesis 1-like isoform X2 [Homarus americanus]